MPVLLLAQGDTTSKDMLRHAIEARYGLRPPVLESLQIDFKGRVRAKLGPINTWVPVEATAYFNFPTSMRWDFSVKAAGVQIGPPYLRNSKVKQCAGIWISDREPVRLHEAYSPQSRKGLSKTLLRNPGNSGQHAPIDRFFEEREDFRHTSYGYR